MAGRLDADELAARAEDAYNARTVGELALVLRDLPGRATVALRSESTPRRWTRRVPLFGTVGAAGATVAAAMVDGVHGWQDGVAAAGFWATVALGSLAAARTVIARRRGDGFASSRRV